MIREGIIIGGRYEVISRIGMGGMADVYKSRDHKLNRFVAVKVLKREFREDETFVKKFQSEAQSVAGLIHPNIVNVYDVGEDRGLYYIVMELVEGIALKDYIQKKGRLTPKEVISIALQVCAGMEAAHSKDIVHRDIKPQNIMISREGKVKVTDFGIAKATSSNTISTNAMGSVHYTSPEQARGGFSDAKSDIYSLGITMYEMITGVLPFDGDSTVSIALKHLQEEIVPPSEIVPEIPYSLEQIILKCTQKSPNRRYIDANQLILDLRHSVVDPEGDFVTISPIANIDDTRKVTEEELAKIQSLAKYDDEETDVEEEQEEKPQRTRNKKEDINPKMAKIMKILAVLVSVIFVFILIFAIGKATGLISMGPGEEQVSEKKVAVPKLVGEKEEDAKKLCEELGLKMKVLLREESEEYDTGLVSSQKTSEGAQVPENTVVQVIVSTGIKLPEFEVPDVKGEKENDAIDILIDAGFSRENIEVSYKNDDEIEKGRVIETTPNSENMASVETHIEVVVSEGAEKAVVPKLVGLTEEKALEELEKAGLKGSAKTEYSDSPEGEVIKQDVDSGEEVDKGTTITFVVSQGEEPTPTQIIPTDLTGKTISSVRAILQNMNLNVDIEYAESYEYYDGYVIAVPASGEVVEEGTTVVVHVSTGPGPQMVDPDVDEEESGETDSQTEQQEQDVVTGTDSQSEISPQSEEKPQNGKKPSVDAQ